MNSSDIWRHLPPSSKQKASDCNIILEQQDVPKHESLKSNLTPEIMGASMLNAANEYHDFDWSKKC